MRSHFRWSPLGEVSRFWLRLALVSSGTAVGFACSSGSGDLRDELLAASGYDENAAEPHPGDACTRDAIVTCGFKQLGTKRCTCAGGVYTQCPCFPPKDWRGALTAPPCDALTGAPSVLRGKACDVGSVCLDRAAPTPATAEGCRCIQGTGVKGQWACGVPAQFDIPSDAASCASLGTGLTQDLKDRPCTSEWQECIGRDWVEGTTEKGCVCLRAGNTSSWACGSTNKWFVPQ